MTVEGNESKMTHLSRNPLHPSLISLRNTSHALPPNASCSSIYKFIFKSNHLITYSSLNMMCKMTL